MFLVRSLPCDTSQSGTLHTHCQIYQQCMWNKPVCLLCWCIFQVHRLCILKKLYRWQTYSRHNRRIRKLPVEPLLCQVHKSNTTWTPFRLGNTRSGTSNMRPLDLPRIFFCLSSIKYIPLYPLWEEEEEEEKKRQKRQNRSGANGKWKMSTNMYNNDTRQQMARLLTC